MNVFNNIRNRFFKLKDAESSPLFGGTPSISGKTVNQQTAMQTSTVYACVRILAETMASLPLHIYKRNENGKERAVDHNLYFLLHNEPNPEMTSFVYRETLMSHLLLWGNAYSQIVRNGKNQIIALYPLLPDKVKVGRKSNGSLYYECLDADGKPVELGSEDILHIPGLGFDGLVGYSPIAMAKNSIGMAIATEEYGAKFFANGANPGGVLEHPTVVKDPTRLRESWNELFQGSGNAGRVAVLEEGLKYKQISIPPEQAQFLETRKFQVEEICRIFRVPPHLVASLDRATFSNIEAQNISFVVHTIRPWLERLESSFDRGLFTREEKNELYSEFNVDGLLRGNYESRMRGYATGIQNGFRSPNDICRLENWDLIENGDVYMVNGNMVRLEDVGAAYMKNRGVKGAHGISAEMEFFAAMDKYRAVLAGGEKDE